MISIKSPVQALENGQGSCEQPVCSAQVLLIGLLLGGCVIGLAHDFATLGAVGKYSVEAGEGLHQQDQFEADLGAALIQRKIGFVGLIIIGMFCWITGRHAPLETGLLTWILLAGLFWATASIAWSDVAHETARELVRLWVYTFVSFALARRFHVDQIAMVLAIAAGSSVAFAVAAEMASGNFQPWVPDYRLSGTIHANILAQHAMFLGLATFAFFASEKRSQFCWLLLISAALVLLLTKSRATLLSFPVGLLAMMGIGRTLRTWVFTFSTVTTVIGMLLLVSCLAGGWIERKWEDVVQVGRNSDNIGSLMGRIPLWEEVWKDTAATATTGFGYGAYWTADRTFNLGQELKWYPRNAHSSYLELVVDIGLVGAAIVLAATLLSFVQTSRNFIQSGAVGYRLVGGFLAAGMINGLVESTYVQPRGMGLFACALVCCLVYRRPVLAPKLSLPRLSSRGMTDLSRSHGRMSFLPPPIDRACE